MFTTAVFRNVNNDSKLKHLNDHAVWVLRHLMSEEVGREVEFMFKVKDMSTGEAFEAFDEELTDRK